MKRLATGLILTPFFFYIVAFAPYWAFLITLAVVGLFCYYEYLGIVAAHYPAFEDLRRRPFGYMAGLILLLLPGQDGVFLTLLVLLLMILSLRANNLAASLPLAAAAAFGVIYVFGSWRCGALLRALNPWWMLFATAINWVGDSFAYYTGKAIGKHRLAPSISPGKSWEGTIASLAGSSVLGVVFLHYLIPAVPLDRAILVAIAANVFGQVGDLCESAIKRGAGLKDSGNLLPGHGGWLDRVDSSLFSVPIVYWLVTQPWFLP